jgi:hypothetical protein
MKPRPRPHCSGPILHFPDRLHLHFCSFLAIRLPGPHGIGLRSSLSSSKWCDFSASTCFPSSAANAGVFISLDSLRPLVTSARKANSQALRASAIRVRGPMTINLTYALHRLNFSKYFR